MLGVSPDFFFRLRVRKREWFLPSNSFRNIRKQFFY
jgi:hypothetical protein